jgi:hypothetical protein
VRADGASREEAARIVEALRHLVDAVEEIGRPAPRGIDKKRMSRRKKIDRGV